MTVITHKDDDNLKFTGADKGECCFCGKKPHPPLLWWRCEIKDLLVCGPCAKKVREGFTYDLIHLTAIEDMREIYPQWTLERKRLETLKREVTAKALEWTKHVNGEDL